MKCLKCGEENKNNAGTCFKCGTPLLWTPDSDPNDSKIKIKVSKLALIAICLTFLGLIFIVFGFMSPYVRRGQSPIFSTKGLLFLSSLIMFVFAVVLGIVSWIRIEISGGLKTGTKFSVGAIVIAILGCILPVLLLFFTRVENVAYKMTCGINLSGLGRAMLFYANDYDHELPRAGGRNATWGTSVNYTATNPMQAYVTQNSNAGSATISSSLYLLVKYVDVTPKSFICPNIKDIGDKGVFEYVPPGNVDLIDLWDFGTQPWMHNSYAYHMPYGKYPLTTSNEPGMAVAADRNPWIPSPGWPAKNFNSFNPDSNPNYGNTPCHEGKGQNVLYLDTHVTFETNPFCGLNEDNIYTSYNGGDIRKGMPPKVDQGLNAVVPGTRIDSFLVNDPIPLDN